MDTELILKSVKGEQQFVYRVAPEKSDNYDEDADDDLGVECRRPGSRRWWCLRRRRRWRRQDAAVVAVGGVCERVGGAGVRLLPGLRDAGLPHRPRPHTPTRPTGTGHSGECLGSGQVRSGQGANDMKSENRLPS